MSKPLTKSDLDAMGCGSPECDHDHSVLFLVAECHPGVAVNLRYDKNRGQLIATCHSCHRKAARIELTTEKIQ